MKTWFTSLNGAITLSAVALLSMLARTFLDFQFVFNEFAPSPGQAGLAILMMTAIFGGWLWALLAAVQNSRAGLIGALGFSLLGFGGGLATMFALCPSPCPTAGGLMEIANWTHLIAGLLAAASVGLYLRQSGKAQMA